MIDNLFKKRDGVTLLELVIVMALVSVVITLSSSMMVLSTKTHKITIDDYEVQTTIRKATDKTNGILRYSSALFTIPKGRFFEANLTAGWNYFGISENGEELISYIYEQRYDESGTLVLKHWKEVVVPSHFNLKYELIFEKDSASNKDNFIKYSIVANNKDTNNKRLEIESEVEAINALQVVDRGTAVTPAVAIAYRSDARPQGETVGTITMVLDVSGSMAYRLDGTSNSVAEQDKRITKLKGALNSMIDEFSKEEYIEIAIVPFSTSANYPSTTSTSDSSKHPFYKVSDSTKKNNLISEINGLSANGGTNTGDGMRRAYHRNKYFTDNISTLYGSGFSTREYMIILVDGVTTYASTIGTNYTSDTSFNYPTDDTYVSNLSTSGNNRLVGNGSSLSDRATKYVEIIGQMIKNRNIKVYVIGFSSVPDQLDSVNDIATSAGALSKDVYKFTDSLDLVEVFEEIKADIMKDLWHIRGPKL